MVAQCPAYDDDENESQKVWTMEMLTNDSDILTNMMNEVESMSDDEKMFLYARVVHSNHSIQYDRIPPTTPGAEPPRDARDSGSARSHSTHLETSSSDRP